MTSKRLTGGECTCGLALKFENMKYAIELKNYGKCQKLFVAVCRRLLHITGQ